jgi:uncharacterized repeat protein (TIGR04042 family)
MPEVLLQLLWPDGEASRFYSPSTVVYEYLQPGQSLSIAELEHKGLAALQEASERVRARYGFAPTRRRASFANASLGMTLPTWSR